MNIKSLISDEEAVSPVIGVILMVAITVILAAVIASFVLGLGEETQSTTPQASWSADYSDDGDAGDDANANSEVDEWTVTHSSGDTVSGDRLSVSIQGASAEDGTNGATDVNGEHDWTNLGGGSEVSAGSDMTIDSQDTNGGPLTSENLADEGGDILDLSESTIRVNWENAEQGNSATLYTWEGPDA